MPILINDSSKPGNGSDPLYDHRVNLDAVLLRLHVEPYNLNSEADYHQTEEYQAAF